MIPNSWHLILKDVWYLLFYFLFFFFLLQHRKQHKANKKKVQKKKSANCCSVLTFKLHTKLTCRERKSWKVVSQVRGRCGARDDSRGEDRHSGSGGLLLQPRQEGQVGEVAGNAVTVALHALCKTGLVSTVSYASLIYHCLCIVYKLPMHI